LRRNGRTAETLDWLREFYIPIDYPVTGQKRIPWDLMPAYWTTHPALYDRDAWMHDPVMQTGDVASQAQTVFSGIDQLLAAYGYHRSGNCYRVVEPNEDTLVFFCHLGVQFLILSHLLGMSAPVLWQNFFVAPTAVTVVQTEEREKGIAAFRCHMLGDVSHLYTAGEPYSRSGSFEEMQ
ncbi:MAG: histidine phosphatase family protein, partial [Clostridia bacterium]|nr:histidine phosphatase family protein [Clostridia bacterium]